MKNRAKQPGQWLAQGWAEQGRGSVRAFGAGENEL